jgi:hypothetical protein
MEGKENLAYDVEAASHNTLEDTQDSSVQVSLSLQNYLLKEKHFAWYQNSSHK